MTGVDRLVRLRGSRARGSRVGSVICPNPFRWVRIAPSDLNYLTTNGLILAQSYYKPGRPIEFLHKDEAARAALEAAYPGREVVMINAEPVNLGGGGIHCITHEEPALR